MATTVLKWGNYGSHLDLDYDFVVSGRSWSLYAALVFRTGNYNMGSWGSTGNTFIHTVSVGGGLPYTPMYSATTLIGRSFITSGTYPTNGAAPSVRFGWGFGVNSSWGGFPNNPSGEVTVTGPAIAAITPPSVGTPSISKISDKSAYASFSITNNNNGSPTDYYMDLSETNFGSVIKTISARSGTFSGLTPNKTYYVRANSANAAGRGYSAVASFKTTFINPGAPGKPSLTYDQPEPIPRAKITGNWNAGTAGSTAVAGYRIRLYKNGSNIESVDTESTDTSYTFPKTLEEYGFEPGDVLAIGIYAYSKDWQGTKFFNGDGASTAIVMSDNLTIVSDKYIWVSVNGQSFNKHKMYISVNGGSFQEVRKEKFKVIK